MDPIDHVLEEILARPEAEWEGAVAELQHLRPEIAAEATRRFGVLREAGLAPSKPRGQQLGEFTLLRILGEGGMGVVYEARQDALGRNVALKLVRPGQLLFPGARERFRREIEAVARLSHPSIVSVFTVGAEEEVPYFAMELLQGAGLDEILRELDGRSPATLTAADLADVVGRRAGVPAASLRGPLFEGTYTDACIEIALRLAQALAHAHLHGVVHRDVKPSNVVVTADGRVVLLDFGLALASDADRLTRTGIELGSLPYLPPEVLSGAPADARSDQYALGLTLYELLTLSHPFLAASAEATRTRILLHALPSPRIRCRAVSRDLATVLAKSLEREISRRYASIDALAADLENVRRRLPIAARPASLPRRIASWARRHPALATGSLLGFLLFAGVPSGIAFGVAEQRDRARAAEREEQLRAYEANIAAASSALSAQDTAEAERRLQACPPELRGFEWRHLAMALDDSIVELPGCSQATSAVAVMPDASIVAAGSVGGEVVLWDLGEGAGARALGTFSGRVEQLAFVDAGRALLVVLDAARAIVLEVASGAVLAERSSVSALERLRIDDDGSRLLSSVGDWNIELLDPITLQTRGRHALERVGEPPLRAFVSVESRLYSLDVTGLRTWDLAEGRSLSHETVPSLSLTLLRAAKGTLAVVDGRGRPWVRFAGAFRAMEGGDSGVRVAMLDPTGTYLIGLSVDRTVRVWQVRDGRRVATLLGPEGDAQCLAFAAERAVLVTGTRRGVRLWCPFGARGRQRLRGHDDYISRLAACTDGTFLSASRDSSVVAWDTRSGEPRQRYGPFAHWVNALAVASGGRSFVLSIHNHVKSFVTGDAAAVAELTAPGAWIHSLALPSGGDVLLAATDDRGALVFDRRLGTLLAELTAHDGPVYSCALSADGRIAFTGGNDGRLVRQRWAVDDSRHAGEIAVLASGPGPVRAICRAAEGAAVYAAAGSTLRAFVSAGDSLAWERFCNSDVLCLAELDGERLASGHRDGSVIVWQARLGRPLLHLALGTAAVRSLVADPHGEWLAAGDEAGSITMLRAERAPLPIAEALRCADVRTALHLEMELHDELCLREEVKAAIEGRRELSADLRAKMSAYANIWLSPSWPAMYRAYQLAAVSGQDRALYERAQRIAAACLGSRANPIATAAIALCSLRLGAYEHALSRCDDVLTWEAKFRDEIEPKMRLVRALALAATGRGAEAEAERDRARASASGREIDAVYTALHAELEAALAR